MNRLRIGFLALLLAGMAQLAPAADAPAAGNWKISFAVPSKQGEIGLDVLILFSQSKGKWVGDVVDVAPKLNVEPLITDVAVVDDTLKFDMPFGGSKFSFDGRFSKDGKKIKGSFMMDGRPVLLELYPSKLKDLKDEFAVAKEVVEQQEGGAFFNTLIPVLRQATKQKLKPEEVRGYADRALKEAEPYGTRWQRDMALGIAGALVDQPPFTAIALEQARQAERMLTDRDSAGTSLGVLEILANALKKNGKADEAKKVDVQLAKAEARDYGDFIKTTALKVEPYAGRKAKGDRVVLVELFTGSECPPCVAADLAFEALDREYKPADVVLMQYHMHIPLPDPMTAPDNNVRAEFYKVRSTPTIFLGGKPGGEMGGPAKAAAVKNKSLRELIDEQLEKPAGAKLTLTGGLKGGEIALTATVDGVKTPGPGTVLRFAITEERVRYAGGNGQRYHEAVVRAFPGGVKGFPVAKNGTEQSVKLKVDDLKASLNKYLDDFGKEAMDDFPDRPLRLKNLRAVAFVQDEASNEVLQAVQLDLEEK